MNQGFDEHLLNHGQVFWVDLIIIREDLIIKSDLREDLIILSELREDLIIISDLNKDLIIIICAGRSRLTPSPWRRTTACRSKREYCMGAAGRS